MKFEDLWPAFRSGPFPISLDQALVLVRELHFRRELTEPVADDILYSIKVDEHLLARLVEAPERPTAPQKRIELWRAPDTTSLAAVSWSPGTLTHIHNHCHFGLTRTVLGSVTSFGFTEHSEDVLTYVGRVHFERNRVYHVPIGKSFIHAVANDGDEPAIELHFYGPLKEGLKSNRYTPLEELDFAEIRDGDRISVKKEVDPEQIERRFN